MAATSRELNEVLRRLWTVQKICRKYNVTPMTVYHWRNRRTYPLPTVVLPGYGRATVRFVPEEVIAWHKAQKEGVTQ
jgi:Homeodomain-like domain